MSRNVLSLMFFKDGYEEWHKPIPEGESFIGRDPECLFRVEDEKLSRKHIKVERTDDLIRLENVSSFGLLYVNDEPREKVEISLNDRIRVEGYEFLVKELPAEVGEPNIDQAPLDPIEASVSMQGPPDSGSDQGSMSPGPSENSINGEAVDDAAGWSPEGFGNAALDTSLEPSSSGNSPGFQGFQEERTEERTNIMSSVSVGKLVVLNGSEADKEFPLSRDEIVIGRSPGSDVVIDDESLSRKHAKIVRSGGIYRVVDLESSNGTRVNGIRVIEQVLKSFDRVQVGDIEFRFVLVHRDFDLQNDNALTEVGHSPLSSGGGLEEVHTQQFALQGLVEEGAVSPTSANGGGPGSPTGAKRRGFKEWWGTRTPQQRRIYVVALAALVIIASLKWMEEPAQEEAKVENIPIVIEPKAKDIPAEFFQLPEDQRLAIERAYNNASLAYQQSNWLEVRKEANFIKSKVTTYKEIDALLSQADLELAKLDKQDFSKITEEQNSEKSEDLYYYLSEADNFLKAANFFEARKNYEKALEIDPSNYEAKRGREAALAQQSDKNWQDKVKQKQEQEDERIKERITQGRLLIEAEQFDQGVELLENVIKSEKPSDPKILQNAEEWITYARKAKIAKYEPDLMDGEELIRQGRFEDAYRSCQRVDLVLPGNERANKCMTVAVLKLEQRARKIYRNALIEEYLGNQKVAKELYERVIQSFPPEVSYYRRAEKKLRRYDPEN